MTVSQKSLANLIPPKPGEVRNPTGRNQWDTLKQSEIYWDQLWSEVLSAGKGKGGTALKDFLRQVRDDAIDGKAVQMAECLKRLVPVIQQHEVKIPGVDTAGLLDALAATAKSRRSNGHDREAHPGSNGGGA